MPIDPRRRHEIAVAVVACDSANPPLPRMAARLLAAMFPIEDVCQRSLDGYLDDGRAQPEEPACSLEAPRRGRVIV
jgi:hypothetical protein